jgi:uncharacterized tellurite resistance protein B-like protein
MGALKEVGAPLDPNARPQRILARGMKSLIELLGLKRPPDADPTGARTATVRKIVQALDALEPQRARFIAAFAYLLGRIANADLDVSAEETRKMEEIVQGFGELPEDQAILVVEIAKSQNRLFGGTENFQVTRELRELASREQREEVLHCLFAVSAADEVISAVEESQLRQIAEELGFSHREYVDVRSSYNDKRSVIQRLGRPS